MCGNEAATHNARAIKKDFKTLGRWVREYGLWLIFSSILPVVGSNIGRNSIPRLEGWAVSMVPQPVALRLAGYTGAHLKSYRDEPGSPELIEVKRARAGNASKQLRSVPLKR